jgi:hypothetical protein
MRSPRNSIQKRSKVIESLTEEIGAQNDPQRTIDDSLAQLEVRDMEDRVAEIDRLLPLASEKEKKVLDEERQKLVLQMRASGKDVVQGIQAP